MAHVCHPNNWEVEAGGSQQVTDATPWPSLSHDLSHCQRVSLLPVSTGLSSNVSTGPISIPALASLEQQPPDIPSIILALCSLLWAQTATARRPGLPWGSALTASGAHGAWVQSPGPQRKTDSNTALGAPGPKQPGTCCLPRSRTQVSQ